MTRKKNSFLLTDIKSGRQTCKNPAAAVKSTFLARKYAFAALSSYLFNKNLHNHLSLRKKKKKIAIYLPREYLVLSE